HLRDFARSPALSAGKPAPGSIRLRHQRSSRRTQRPRRSQPQDDQPRAVTVKNYWRIIMNGWIPGLPASPLSLAARGMKCCLVAPMGLAALLLAATSASATVTNVAWYHLGEDDSGAVVGGPAVLTHDSIGNLNLITKGGPVYSADVAE